MAAPALESSLMRCRILADALRLDSLSERHRRPACSRSRNPLIVAIGESALKVGLYPDGTRLHVPGAVGRLSAQQILRSLNIDRIRGRYLAGGGERVERLTRGIGIRTHGGQLVPA